MTSLLNRNQSTATHIQDLTAQIASIQERLNALTAEVRITNQRHKAQENLTKEWQSNLKQMTKLFKDACSVYGEPQALQDMLSDVSEVIQTVTNDFDDYVDSDRYLNQETAQVEDVEDDVLPIESAKSLQIAESVPDEDDDEILLSSSQVSAILKPESDDLILNLRDLAKLNGNMKRRSSIIKAIAEKGITRLRLSKAIELAKQDSLMLFAS